MFHSRGNAETYLLKASDGTQVSVFSTPPSAGTNNGQGAAIRPADFTGYLSNFEFDDTIFVVPPGLIRRTNIPGDYDFCRDCGPCAEGEGDCDSDSECENGLTCFQISGKIDVCQDLTVCPHPIGHWDYCRDCGPCDLGQGDCDSDSECRGGLFCEQVTGAVDVCEY